MDRKPLVAAVLVGLLVILAVGTGTSPASAASSRTRPGWYAKYAKYALKARPAINVSGCTPSPDLAYLPNSGGYTIIGTSGPDVICGTSKTDTVLGLDGNDTIVIGGDTGYQYDVASPGDGDDLVTVRPEGIHAVGWVRTGTIEDLGPTYHYPYFTYLTPPPYAKVLSLDPGNGNDTIRCQGTCFAWGGNGNDLLDARFYGHSFLAELHGGPGNDTLRGSIGPSWLEGDDGNDLLIDVDPSTGMGATALDIAVGGPGADMGIMADLTSDSWYPDTIQDKPISLPISPETDCTEEFQTSRPPTIGLSCPILGPLSGTIRSDGSVEVSLDPNGPLSSVQLGTIKSLYAKVTPLTHWLDDACVCDKGLSGNWIIDHGVWPHDE